MKRSRDALCTTVYLIRHGARHDFADKAAWRATCNRLGHETSDPPLSALGHAQARETAAALSGEGIEHILVSPYLRVLQTAQPLAHMCSLPLRVEEGLAELAYAPATIPSAGARVAYFPEIEDEADPIHPPVQPASNGVESNLAYLRRMLRLAASFHCPSPVSPSLRPVFTLLPLTAYQKRLGKWKATRSSRLQLHFKAWKAVTNASTFFNR